MIHLRAEVLEIELLAVREIEPGKHLVVMYGEWTDDGFIIDGVCDPPHAFFGEEGATMAIADFQDYLTLIPAVHRAPQHAVWLTYDDGADTLYVNFKKPSQATDSELTDGDVIIRYEGSEVIGFAVLHASKRVTRTA